MDKFEKDFNAYALEAFRVLMQEAMKPYGDIEDMEKKVATMACKYAFEMARESQKYKSAF